MSEHAQALLALWNDVAPELDDAYNEWHANEHVPERLTVPGILWARRYRSPAPGSFPRYLTLYGLRDARVLDSAPYRRLLAEPTPMSRSMRPALCNVSRWVCKLHRSDLEPERSGLWVAVMPDGERPDMAQLEISAHAQGILLAERIDDAAPLPWLGARQGGGVDGRWLVGVQAEANAQRNALPGFACYEPLPVAC